LVAQKAKQECFSPFLLAVGGKLEFQTNLKTSAASDSRLFGFEKRCKAWHTPARLSSGPAHLLALPPSCHAHVLSRCSHPTQPTLNRWYDFVHSGLTGSTLACFFARRLWHAPTSRALHATVRHLRRFPHAPSEQRTHFFYQLGNMARIIDGKAISK